MLKFRKACCLCIVVAIVLIFCACARNNGQNETLLVDFINVGQGDSTLISLPDGRFILCDTGPESAKHALNDQMRSRKVDKLAMLILTHPHNDHIGNADDVVKRYDIETLLMPDASSTHPTYDKFTRALSHTDIEITHPSAGDVYTFGDVTLTVLSPNGTNYTYEDLNEISIMFRLSYKDTDFLICADNTPSSQGNVLLSGAEISSEVLKVPHHGSKDDAVQAFINAVAPDYAVISYGIDNTYGHPHNYTLGLLDIAKAEVFETAYGTVTVSTDGKNITVE
ncbi:MAG: MBL fold metallo-hydrolase [Ruminococcaceae bacterium]|nr:MBL fold metallo-hydrolase [Oscillospiraceae bacterium]